MVTGGSFVYALQLTLAFGNRLPIQFYLHNIKLHKFEGDHCGSSAIHQAHLPSTLTSAERFAYNSPA